MKTEVKLNEGELVIIGALQEVNTPENLVGLAVQIGKKAGKHVTVVSKKMTITHLLSMYGGKVPKGISICEEDGDRNIYPGLLGKGIILWDNPSGPITGVISSLYYHAKETGTTVVVVVNTPKHRDNAGRANPDLRYVDGYCNFINYCSRVFLWKDKLNLTLYQDIKSISVNETRNWLLRRDGKIFAVERDMVIDGEPFLEVQLYNIVWLFEHTLKEETKRHITAFVRKLCITNGKPWEMDYIGEALGSKLKTIAGYECDSAGYLGVYDYFDKVLLAFDEEFLHVCFGGEYHPLSGNRDLFFRISSEDFDWSNVIKDFKSNVDITYTDEHITIDKLARERNPKVGIKDSGEGLWYFYG